jgi:hypothetical protein
VRVVVQGVGAGELVPGGAVAGSPGLADGLGLRGFDRAGGEAEFALGDAGPDEGGGLLSFAVVEGGLDWSRDGWQPAGDASRRTGSSQSAPADGLVRKR